MIRHTISLFCIGILLFGAAALKIAGGAVDPVEHMGIFSLHAAQVAIVNVEILLAIWLWSRAFPSCSWSVAVIIFACFAVISGYQGWVGKSSCGCFGKLTVHPWIALSLDAFVLLMLALGRPTRDEFSADVRALGANIVKRILVAAVVAGVLVASLTAYGFWRRGSLESAVAELRGEPVSVEPFIYDVGRCNQFDRKEITVRVVNRLSRPIRIVGQSPDCTCRMVSDVPMTIPPQDAVEVQFSAVVTANEGIFSQEALLFLDTGHLDRVRFQLAGQVMSPSKE